MKQPLVSIIIPNYCHAKYLNQRIQSVLNQTYQNFEVIILDDCSPDNGASKAVIERYRRDKHVSHIEYNEQNSGSTFRQWHKGFSLAQGELIWIAESDDYCEPNILEELVYAFTNHENVVLAYTNITIVDSNGNTSPVNPGFHNLSAEKLFYNGKDYIKECMFQTNAIWNASCAVFRKDIATTIDKGYMNYKSAGDYLFWVEVAECGNVVKIPKQLNYFRIHTTNVTPASMLNGTTIEEMHKVYKYMKNKGLLPPLLALKSKLLHIKEIQTSTYGSIEIKQKLLKMVDPYNIYRPRIANYILRYI